MSLKGKLHFVGLTDTGKVREHNEDTIAFDADIGLLVLADGMGGYNAGEVASGIAVKTIVNLVREAVEREDLERARTATSGMSRAQHHPARCDPPRQQDHLPDRAHPAAMRRHGHDRGRAPCSSTTRSRSPTSAIRACTACGASKLRAGHAWTTRCCRSWSTGASIPPEEAQRAANKNYVTRALGVEPDVEVEIQEYRSRRATISPDVSDGLSDMVEDDDIHLTINTFSANLDTVAKQLIQLANDNGGRDNVSVVMAHVMDAFPARTRIFDKILGWFG